jgi:hypothetical protein
LRRQRKIAALSPLCVLALTTIAGVIEQRSGSNMDEARKWEAKNFFLFDAGGKGDEMSSGKTAELDDFLKRMFLEEPAPISTNIVSPLATISDEPIEKDDTAAVQAGAVDATPAPPQSESALRAGEQAKALLAGLEIKTAVRLRWAMRDIRSKRTTMFRVSENDLAALMDMGLIEMGEERPILTGLGVLALDKVK